MNQLWIIVCVILNLGAALRPAEVAQTMPVRFVGAAMGRTVTICIDGQRMERAFAGKLTFQDSRGSFETVCADVRSPISSGQMFLVRPISTKIYGGSMAMAGHIVAACFRLAQTPEQCAGLQIAVWKAIEDGSDGTNFRSGRFQVIADPVTMSYAIQDYRAADLQGTAMLLFAGGGQGAGGQGNGAGQGAAGQTGGQGGGGQGGQGGGQGQLLP